MYQRTVLGLLWLTAGAAAMAQTVDYPVQKSKTPEARTAGIGSYHLTREGEVVTAEAFDLEGDLLADCEAQWPEDSGVMTCTMSDGGHFRATWYWYEERAELEDLDTGDHVAIYRGDGPPLRAIDMESGASRPKREGAPPSGTIDVEPGAPRPERGNWVVRGTKTWEEAERDWGHITPIFGNLLGEIEITLGIRWSSMPGGRISLRIPGTERLGAERLLNEPI